MGKGKYDEIGTHADPKEFAKFTLGFIAVQVVGLVMVILSGVWMSAYHGGYGWDVTTVFNYHPLFMTMGMIFLYGDGKSFFLKMLKVPLIKLISYLKKIFHKNIP